MGGFVGEGQEEWIEKKIDGWVNSIKKLAEISCFIPQSTFVGLQRSLQHEWVFVQRVTDFENSPEKFRRLEVAISEILIPEIFGCNPPSRKITKLPFKFSGLSVPDPSQRAAHNFHTSRNTTKTIIDAIREKHSLALAEHNIVVTQSKAHIKKQNAEWAK